jgi:RNA polymerase sigma factor (sigma-70 family)
MQRDSEYVEYVSARLPALHRAAYLLCGDGHRADDIVAATTMVLYRHWRKASDANNIDAYVHKILVRKFLEERRLHWARVRLLPYLPEQRRSVVSWADSWPDSSPERGVEQRDLLRDALAQLSRPQRTVLVLRFACDMSVDEVAAVLRCSPGNVKSHTSRGLAAMRRVLGVGQTASADS